MGQNVKWKNSRMGQNVEWKYGKKNMYKYFWFFITTNMYILIMIIFTLMFMYLKKKPLDTICIVMSKMV
jgi:hypothetical protein